MIACGLCEREVSYFDVKLGSVGRLLPAGDFCRLCGRATSERAKRLIPLAGMQALANALREDAA